MCDLICIYMYISIYSTLEAPFVSLLVGPKATKWFDEAEFLWITKD